MTRPWLLPAPVSVPEALREATGGHLLVAETLVRRGFADVGAARAFLDPAAYIPAPSSELPGMARAVTRLGRAIRGGEPICVWGDFDVDGQTATALLVSCLADLGAQVSYHVPNRETEGHGISLPALDNVINRGAHLILTCDTGIASHAAVNHARGRGVDVIITDHHDLPATLPDAVAVISPKLTTAADDAPHPLYDLPGVGVAYKLAEALYDWARRSDDASRLLDLVALGIVADLAVQRGDTRYLLQRGLAALRRTQRLGLQVLMETAELDPAHLSEEHIGFVIGPRLNAAGRLADATPCVELLTLGEGAGPRTTDRLRQDLTRARIIAADLQTLNARRKVECDAVERAAEAQIQRDPALLDAPALVLDSLHWPPGVIGIVASRLVEAYGKPAILIATPAGGLGRASARSVEGLHITEAIATQAHLLAGFGGHPMAAGFTIEPRRIGEFRRGFLRAVEVRSQGRRDAGLPIDGSLPLADLTLDLTDDLARLAPFGPGNPPLVLIAERLRVKADRQVGRNDEHRVLLVTDEAGNERSVVWWDGGDETAPEGLFDLAYVARSSTFRGQRDVQVELVAVRPSAGAEPVLVQTGLPFEVTDWRRATAPRTLLADVLAAGDAAVWCEGGESDIAGEDRHSLTPAAGLVIWTAPPGPAELRAAVARVQPARVYLVGQDPHLDQPETFLRRLTGLTKHVVNAREGRTTPAALAAATAQTETTVRLGLEWLTAAGQLAVTTNGPDLNLAAGSGRPSSGPARAALSSRLSAALAESAAYRAHFRRAPAESLFRSTQ